MKNVIRTASDDSCGGGLGARHERNRICRFAHAKLVTFELIKTKKKLSFLLYPMRLGLRNNEFTYHGLTGVGHWELHIYQECLKHGSNKFAKLVLIVHEFTACMLLGTFASNNIQRLGYANATST